MLHHFRPGDDVFWWKLISGWNEYPYRAEVVVIGNKRIKIAVKEEEDDTDRVIRHVRPERLQPVGKYYEKAGRQGPANVAEVESWGLFTRYLEIGEDLRAVRLVDKFRNGNMLCYDRSHWVDNFGMLGDGRLNRNCKQGPWGRSREIAAGEFERVWAAGQSSPIWQQQVATARMKQLGAIPIWLTIKGWRPSILKRK